VTYLITFFAEKVTHSLKNLFVLTQMMQATAALLSNPTIYLDPYIASIVPPVLTCLVGKHLGPSPAITMASSDSTMTNGISLPATSNSLAHFALRDLAASILSHICKRYAETSTTLKPRIARTCLKQFMDPAKPFGTHYGAVIGLLGIAGQDGVRLLLLPNLRLYDSILKEGLAEETRKAETEMVIRALMQGLSRLEDGAVGLVNGVGNSEDVRDRLAEKVGDVLAERVAASGRPKLVTAVLEADVNL
jgi:transcription initiation factor TFIID subunit 6